MLYCQNSIEGRFRQFIAGNNFPCVAAKDALAKDNLQIFTAKHFACPADDEHILAFLYHFADTFRNAEKGFHSAAVIFELPVNLSEEMFDIFMWQRLKALKKLDQKSYRHDTRVSDNPLSPDFSFSLKEEAFFIVGLHANSSRPARKFTHPVLVFNPHAQFEAMKTSARYEKMKAIVRKKDIALSGSVNPMLTDFGDVSEVYQYSGRLYDKNWSCPLQK